MDSEGSSQDSSPTIHYRSGGPSEGPVVLLLHGVTRQAIDLTPVYERLPRTWRWIAADFRGHGESARSDRGYQVRDYLEDVAQLLERIDQERVVLFGHSLGAMVAATAAARWPQRIAGAILEDPPFSTMGSRFQESTFYRQFVGMAELVQARPDAESLYQQLRELPVCRPDNGQAARLSELRDDQAIRTHANYLATMDPRVLDPIVEGRWLEGYDLEGIARSIRCPVLLFQADPQLGGMLTSAEADLICQSVEDCRFVQVSGAGHLIHASHADLLAGEIQRFLKRIHGSA